VQTAALIQCALLRSRRLQQIERSGFGGKESECVEVTALDAVGFDDFIGSVLTQAQRNRVAVFVLAIHHCPFVQTKAAELGWATQHGTIQRGDGTDQIASFLKECACVNGDVTGCIRYVPSGSGVLLRI